VRPSLSPGAPEVRAATISRSAASPSSTKVLVPFSTKPSPDLAADSAVFSGAWCEASSTARVATASPAAIFGSQAAFWASEPPSTRAEAAIRAVESRGEATRLRPVSSRISPRPR
jgi:hypothetical protein